MSTHKKMTPDHTQVAEGSAATETGRKSTTRGTKNQAPTLASEPIDVPPTAPTTDAAATQAAVASVAACLFEPTDIVEVRRLPSGRSCWCKASELPGIANSLASENRNGENVFFGANPRVKSGGTKSADVALARCLFCDFDKCDLADVRRRLDEAGLPTPTLLVLSGGGCHSWWRLSEPMVDLKLWSRYQKALATLLGSDPKVCDAPRIMRLAGFDNLKYNPARPCEIVEAEADRTYSLDEFADVLEQCHGTAPEATAAPAADGVIPEGARNTSLYNRGCFLRRGGFSEVAILAALQAMNIERCKPPLPESDIRKIANQAVKYEPDGITVATLDDHYGQERAVPSGGTTEGTSDVPAIVEWEPMPIDVLPELMRTFITQASESAMCDPAYVAAPLLSAIASAIGNGRRLEMKEGGRDEYTAKSILWTMCVGDSGDGKSPGSAKALHWVEQRQEKTKVDFLDAMVKYEKSFLQYEKRLTTWKRKTESNDAKTSTPPTPPKKPVWDRAWTSDSTIEGLTKLLMENWCGLLLESDELDSWLSGFDAYKNGGGDCGKWLSLYNARPITVDRAGGGVRDVPMPSVSITGSIQPDTLRKSLGEKHFSNGLAARFLPVMPPRTATDWAEAKVDPDIKSRMDCVFDFLYSLDAQYDLLGNPHPIDLTMTTDAKSLYVGYFNPHNAKLKSLRGKFAAAESKLAETPARLALIIHMFRQAAHEPVSDTQVDATDMATGVALTKWWSRETKRVYDRLKQSEGDDERSKLVDWITRHGRETTARELQRCGPSPYRKAKAAEDALCDLVRHDFGMWESRPPQTQGGRPTRVFMLT